MHARRNTPHFPQRSRRLALPLLLYDLSAASQVLTDTFVLPEQFSAPPSRTSRARGAAALLGAVLEDALQCFQKQFLSNRPRVQRLGREAEAWFFADDPHWPFSFINICAALGLDPAYLRRGLLQWRQHYAAGPQKPRRLLVPAHRPLKRAA